MKWKGRLLPRIKATKPDIPRKLPAKFTEQGLCVGYRAGIEDLKTDVTVHESVGGEERPKDVPRMRLRCPRCKRRVWSSVRTCGDGCCVYHDIPPHKPKRWWKR